MDPGGTRILKEHRVSEKRSQPISHVAPVLRRRAGLVFCCCFSKYFFSGFFGPIISASTGPIFTKFA